MRNFLKKLIRLPSLFLVGGISLYQHTLSPDHGWFKKRYPYGYCRHYPTCSEYSKQAISKYGIIKGVSLSGLRVLRCNPWVEPSVDNLK